MDWRRKPDHPVVRFARRGGLALIGVVVMAGIMFLLIPLAARAFVRGITLMAEGCIWLATSISMGESIWTMLTTMRQTATSVVATPTASAVLWGFVVVGGLALYWLQRLLGSEEE